MMHRMIGHAGVVLALLVVAPAPAWSQAGGGIGVLGDSYADEYQFYRPIRSTARNWVENLAVNRRANFGPYSLRARPGPRERGYEYNWSRSGATTASLLAEGQHTGLAAQVARGQVRYVVLFIGGNDFLDVFTSRDPLGELAVVVPRAAANFAEAVRTILAANPGVRLVVATVPVVRTLPLVAGAIRFGFVPVALADAVAAGVEDYNDGVRAVAASDPRIALADLAAASAIVLAGPQTLVGGVRVDTRTPGNSARNFFLADGIHPGTVGQGIIANQYLAALNRLGAGIRPLSDREILRLAGRR